jgi:hypothetical protein
MFWSNFPLLEKLNLKVTIPSLFIFEIAAVNILINYKYFSKF